MQPQLEKQGRERVRGFEKSKKKILCYHVNRLHRRAVKYQDQPEKEEQYFRTLKALGYLMQSMIAAQRSAFEQELSIVEEMMEAYDGYKADYDRLKASEEAHQRAAQQEASR